MRAYKTELVPGVIRIQIGISARQELVELREVSNTSNPLAAKLTLDAIRRARIPQVPAQLLVHGVFREECTFKIYRDRPNDTLGGSGAGGKISLHGIGTSSTAAMRSPGGGHSALSR